MGKKKGPKQKGEAVQVAFGGGGPPAAQQPPSNPTRTVTQHHSQQPDKPFYETEERKQPQAAAVDNDAYAPVDFGQESKYQKKSQMFGQPTSHGHGNKPGGHRKVNYQAAEQVQPTFMGEDRGADSYQHQRQSQSNYQPQQAQRYNQNSRPQQQQQQQHYQQPQQSAYQARQANTNNQYGGNNRQGGQPQFQRQRSDQQYSQQNSQAQPQNAGGQKKPEAVQRIEAPKVDEEVASAQKQDFADFDLKEQLGFEPLPNGKYAIDDSRRQMNVLLSQLQDCVQVSKATPPPATETVFGAEAIQPLQPPLFFSLGDDQRNFETGIGPWRLTREQITSKMLLRETSQVKADTFDAIFKMDIDDLKRKAACDRYRNDELLQAEVAERMNQELGSIERQIAQSTNLELSAIRLDPKAEINVASGQLASFSHTEPKEPFELEEEFDQATQNAKDIMLSSRLQDEQEIDQLLEVAADPFGEVPLDDEGQTDQIIGKFLTDLRDMDVLQQHQEKLLEKLQQQERETAGFKAQQLRKKEIEAGDSEAEEEESKEPQSASAAAQSEVMIDTTKSSSAQDDSQSLNNEETKAAESEDLDQIDEIVGESSSFTKAVKEQQKLGENASRLQAEPSHFHLAALEQERKRRPVKKLGESNATGEEEKEENWVVTDKVSMVNFKQLVQDPAIEYPFELDDFQKRAVFRLEQGNCVMVAAHTSAGKTLVAEYAIALSRRHMTKTIYTSPIKSLSNQKYRDFKLKFGDVGMLTGDVQLNKDASCLIMTTEILQQMLYNDSSRIADVEWVIFDEVHYINDEQRGSVWEEVIIKLPDTVSIVMLSATVPNYLEFAQWVGRVKQKKIYVQYTQERPVPLQHNSIIDGRMVPLKQQNKPVDQTALKDCAKHRGILKNKSYAEKNNKQGQGNKPQQNSKQIMQEKDQRETKKIDFKSKAIKHKENSVKKVIAKNMKSSGGSGPSTGAGQGVNGKKKSNFEKTLLAVQQMNLLPSIVFTFSRAGTFQYANELDPQIDFTDGYTKGLIKKFIKQKLQRLDEVDRDLPQIEMMTKLMSRGIGIHHAGLLQILKELVEILFSDGYLKVVFATSTFAIGLNLPARSVVFTGLKKFDGSEFGTISTSEYLQMAGRAGRRGKDDCGFSVLCMDPGHQVPPNQELVELLESKGIELESKLNVNYDMCLNSLKQDSDEFGTMLKNSFFANETATVKIQARQKRKRIEPILERAMDLQCVYGKQLEIQELYKLIDLLWDSNDEIAGGLEPIPLTIVQVVTEKHLFKDAIVLANHGKYKSFVCLFQPAGESLPIAYEEDNANGDFESAAQHCRPTQVLIPGSKGELLQYECLEISNCMITATYNEHVTSVNQQHLHFIKKNQLSEKHVKLLAKEYHSKLGNLSVAPISFGGKKRTKAKMMNIQQKRENIIEEIRKTKCWNCEQVSYHLTQLEVQDKYRSQMAEIDKILQGNVDEKEADFNNRNGILTHYKIIDDDLNILFKGKVAMQACQDKVLLTEFFFSGLIGDLSDQELLAILSIFVTTERASGSVADCGKQYSEKFTEAYNFVEQQANALIQLEQDAGVMEEQILDKRLNFKFYELVYDWADQQTFKGVVEETGIDEGSVIKMIMSVNRTRQAIEKMATVVGDNALATRMQEMEALINRGIVKMQSLYLEVEQEPQQLTERAEDFILNFDADTGEVMPAKKK